MRLIPLFLGAVAITVGLFWLMQWLVTPPEGDVALRPDNPPITVAKPPDPEDSEAADSAQLSEAPPAPPSVPSVALSLNASVSLPPAETKAAAFSVPKVKPGGGSLTKGQFGGFAGGGGGDGSGYGQGKGFKGKRLVPLSTARPQIPEWAYERGIEGWVEVAFVVNTNGRVSNIRIIDAEPKGVFETAMVESIRNWIYPQTDNALEVKQRFEFKLDDFQYNWN